MPIVPPPTYLYLLCYGKLFNQQETFNFFLSKTVWIVFYFNSFETSCRLNKSLVLKWFYGLEREKIIEYDFYTHREYLDAVSHKVKSFQ